MKNSLITITILVSSLIPAASQTAIYTVPGTANIYASGLTTTVAPAGGGGGILPILVPVSGSGNSFQFQVSGNISQAGPSFYHSADGWTGGSENFNAYGGISGFFGPTTLPLVGVFLSDATPQAPAPATLDFTTIGINFLNLSPLLGQQFFIGDGLTAGALTQTFYAPAGATRLYLGCPDGVSYQGDPGSYGDNFGSLSVTVNQVPEPGSAALLLLGAALMMKIKRSSN